MYSCVCAHACVLYFCTCFARRSDQAYCFYCAVCWCILIALLHLLSSPRQSQLSKRKNLHRQPTSLSEELDMLGGGGAFRSRRTSFSSQSPRDVQTPNPTEQQGTPDCANSPTDPPPPPPQHGLPPACFHENKDLSQGADPDVQAQHPTATPTPHSPAPDVSPIQRPDRSALDLSRFVAARLEKILLTRACTHTLNLSLSFPFSLSPTPNAAVHANVSTHACGYKPPTALYSLSTSAYNTTFITKKEHSRLHCI